MQLMNSTKRGSVKNMTQAKKITEYSILNKFLHPLDDLPRQLVGRDAEVRRFVSALHNSIMSNPCILGYPGTGKTALVQGVKKMMPDFNFYELDLQAMKSSSKPMGALIKSITSELKRLYLETGDKNIVFIDEMHLLFMYDEGEPAQALKPDLSKSAESGLYFAFATTLKEYRKYIASDEAFDERMVRISLPELPVNEVGKILKNMILGEIDNLPKNTRVEKDIVQKIIKLSERYIQSEKQPRKAMTILDNMLGNIKAAHYFDDKYNLDTVNLADVLKYLVGVDISWSLDISSLQVSMESRLLAQPVAIEAVINRLYLMKTELNDPDKPLGSFLFTGPTGVGKTELAKILAEASFGSENRMIRFDMSEYALPDSVDKLRERLAEQVWAEPHNVILVDEIEKAANECSRLFLQILDDARVTDNDGRIVSFKDTLIIMTTNVAQEVYKGIGEDIGILENISDDEVKKMLDRNIELIYKSLESDSSFPVELLNRIDVITPFGPLPSKILEKIAKLRLYELKKLVWDKQGVIVHFDKKVLDYVVHGSDVGNNTSRNNGRTVKNKIDSDVSGKIAKFILDNPYDKDINVNITGILAIKTPNHAISTAKVVVGTDDIDKEVDF